MCFAFFGQSLPSLAASLQQGLLAAEEGDKMALNREPTASHKSKTSVSIGEEEKDAKLMLLLSYTMRYCLVFPIYSKIIATKITYTVNLNVSLELARSLKNKNPSTEKASGHKVPPLTKKLSAIGSCWKRESSFLQNIVIGGGDDLPMRTCLSQRISFIPLQRRKRGNTRKSAWCRAPIPTLWM